MKPPMLRLTCHQDTWHCPSSKTPALISPSWTPVSLHATEEGGSWPPSPAPACFTGALTHSSSGRYLLKTTASWGRCRNNQPSNCSRAFFMITGVGSGLSGACDVGLAQARKHSGLPGGGCEMTHSLVCALSVILCGHASVAPA